MGYEANFSGNFTMKRDEKKIETVKSILNSGKLFLDFIDTLHLDDSTTVIEIESGGYVPYNEDRIGDTLGKLIPYIETGSIEYRGEDDSLWKHEFLNGKWQELTGEITYGNPVEMNIDYEEPEMEL